jgi:hypothetical protein
VVIVEIILEIAKSYGPFVALVAYVLWQNQRREEKYISVIERLSKAFESLKKDISDIKQKVYEKEDGK